MWFLGLLAGLIIGGVIGGFGGALAGAVLGALVAGAFRVNATPAKAPDRNDVQRPLDLEQKINHIYSCLEDVNRRLAALERSAPDQEQKNQYAEPVPVPAPALEGGANSQVPPFVEPPVGELGAVAPMLSAVQSADAVATPEAITAPLHVQPAREPNVLVRWLIGGNTLVRIGMTVLFVGVAFLLKYAAERDIVPIELRLAGVAAGAVALLLVGWRLRERRPGYALMLQGGAVALLYLTVFAALRLYQLLPAAFAFAVLTVIAASAAALAVLQNSRALAITGAVGGFMAPVLTSTGAGNHIALFSFYAFIDAGILAVAYHKAWRELNLVGFAFTFAMGLLWGSKYYRPELFATTEPFLLLFFLFYVAIAVLFALRRAPQLLHYVDGTIVFGTPLIAFGLQTALVRDMEFGAAWSALGFGAFYIVLASMLYARKRDALRLLVESFLALGVGFATLAVPLAFDGRWTSAIWAVEGAAILWVGMRQQRPLARAFGILLQLAAGVAFAVDPESSTGKIAILNSFYLGCVLISTAGLFCSIFLQRNQERITEVERATCNLLFVWGTLWWFGGGFVEIHRHVQGASAWPVHLFFAAASCAIYGVLARRLDWQPARYVSLMSVPLAAALLIVVFVTRGMSHPFAHYAYASWLVVFGVHLWALRRNEDRPENMLEVLHAAGFWLLALVLSWESGWQIDRYVEGQRVWPLIGWAIVPTALVAIFAGRSDKLGWPINAHRHAYLYAGAMPLCVFVLAWVVYVNFASNGDPAPLPYVPLLNPLDIAQAAAMLSIAMWYVAIRRLNLDGALLPAAEDVLKLLGVILFVMLNGVLLRTLHHYADVPFRLDSMLRSVLVQAALSLFWTLLALAAMVTAARRGLRALWGIGAALLAIVIVKLILIDLASSGTVERWVSFIGVGVLVIVIGYFAPVPPKAEERAV